MLKKNDAEKIESKNAANGWAIPWVDLLEMLIDYRRAKESGDSYAAEMIEYRLTDCNFHTEARLLKSGKYEEYARGIFE